MQIILGIIITIAILVTAHFAQRTTQEIKKLNSKIDELIRVLTEK